MSTYIVFDKKSGEIVHAHSEVDLSGESVAMTKDEVIALAKSRLTGDAELDVLDIGRELALEGFTGRKQCRVDPKTRSLVQK